MAKPAAAPPPWGTVGNYGASNYQDPLPWGAANPLGGGPTPWSNGPRLDAVGLAAFAAAGVEPEVPTPAESFNEWLRQAQLSLQWLQDGSATDDADAHLVETDGSGAINVQGGVFTLGVFGKAGAAVLAPNGLTVPAGKILKVDGTTVLNDAVTVNDSLSILGAGGGSMDSDPTAVMTWNGTATLAGRVRLLASIISTVGDIGKDGFGNLIWHDGQSPKNVYVPFVADTPTATTAAVATDIAGMAITLTIEPTRQVLIEVFVKQEVDTAGQSPNVRIRAQNDLAADIVPLLKAGDDDAAISTLPATVANGDRRPNSVEVVWSPDEDIPIPANNTWTIQVQHGVSGGASVKTTASIIRITYR